MAEDSLLKKGIDSLRAGDLYKPLRFLIDQYEKEVVGIRCLTDPPRKPSWWNSQENLKTLEVTDSDSQIHMRYEIGTHEKNIQVSPKEPIKSLSIPVLNVKGVSSFTITANAETKHGNKERKKFEWKNGEFNKRSFVTVSIKFDNPVIDISVSLKEDIGNRSGIRNAFFGDAERALGTPRLHQCNSQKPPIIFISVDSFRHDQLSTFKNVVEKLGPHTKVPKEPRTQGHWTRPSHASTFTGAHTAEHGYVVGAADSVPEREINRSLITLPEYLQDDGYTTRGCVSTRSISGKYGFSRGFHQFEETSMDWELRKTDSATVIDRAIDWLDRDSFQHQSPFFYFLHVYDPHFPYIPPVHELPENKIDWNLPSRFRDRRPPNDYLEAIKNPSEAPPEERERIIEYYKRSCQYTASQIERLIDALSRSDILRDALIIIAGDHGEEFYERGFPLHSTLYDANIRPGTIIKPPNSADWSIPDMVDYIDFFPTIAKLLDKEPPDQCQGEAFQDTQEHEYRITEYLRDDRYSVSIEKEGFKLIQTYESDFPQLPSKEEINSGPLHSEWYKIENVRKDSPTGQQPKDQDLIRDLKERGVDFTGRVITEINTKEVSEVSQETKDRLKQLGYR